jgi:hypothetical protein
MMERIRRFVEAVATAFAVAFGLVSDPTRVVVRETPRYRR